MKTRTFIKKYGNYLEKKRFIELLDGPKKILTKSRADKISEHPLNKKDEEALAQAVKGILKDKSQFNLVEEK